MSGAYRRRVILHYHLFKNAGTSIDEMLSSSFGERWLQWDKTDGGAKIAPQEMEQFILDHPDALAISSHQVVPPLPTRHVDVYPIIFIRHPIDRAFSAYLFEWQKQQGTEKPIGLFEEYVKRLLANPRKNAIEEFQVLQLANQNYDAYEHSGNLDDEDVLAHVKTLISSLPTFGIVERYDESLRWMQRNWGGMFPDLKFNVHRSNVLQDPARSLGDKMAVLRRTINPQIFGELVLRNQMDLRLYEYASARFDAAVAAMPAPRSKGLVKS